MDAAIIVSSQASPCGAKIGYRLLAGRSTRTACDSRTGQAYGDENVGHGPMLDV